MTLDHSWCDAPFSPRCTSCDKSAKCTSRMHKNYQLIVQKALLGNTSFSAARTFQTIDKALLFYLVQTADLSPEFNAGCCCCGAAALIFHKGWGQGQQKRLSLRACLSHNMSRRHPSRRECPFSFKWGRAQNLNCKFFESRPPLPCLHDMMIWSASFLGLWYDFDNLKNYGKSKTKLNHKGCVIHEWRMQPFNWRHEVTFHTLARTPTLIWFLHLYEAPRTSNSEQLSCLIWGANSLLKKVDYLWKIQAACIPPSLQVVLDQYLVIVNHDSQFIW